MQRFAKNKAFAMWSKLVIMVTIFIIGLLGYKIVSDKEFHQSTLHELSYTISRETYNGAPALRIQLEFLLDKSGKGVLVVPSKWSQGKKIYETIRNLEIVLPDKPIVHYNRITEKDTSSYLDIGGTYLLPGITANPHEKIVVRYLIVSPDVFDAYKPDVQESYFFFVGRLAFVHPYMSINQDMTTVLNWDLTDSPVLANSYGINEKKQIIKGPLKHIKESVFAGGDFRIQTIKGQKGTIVTILRGQWLFSDKKFSDVISKIIMAQRKFFNDFDFPYYLTLLQPVEGKYGFSGSALHNSFKMFMPQDTDLKRISWLISHEHFHSWNGLKIAPQEANGITIKWFIEGFTEYYANLFCLRLGIFSLQDYVDKYNATLYKHFTSTVRTKPNAYIVKDYYSNRDRQIDQLPYYRGEIIAHNWNTLIKKSTLMQYSLDNVILDLFSASREKGIKTTAEFINQLIKKYIPTGVQSDIKTFIEHGSLMNPNNDALGPICKLVWKKMPKKDFGFDRRKSRKTKIISGVRPETLVYKLGMRNGQALLNMSPPPLFKPDIEQLVKVGIKDYDEVEKIIEYYPIGDEEFYVPQYVLDQEKLKKQAQNTSQWFGTSD